MATGSLEVRGHNLPMEMTSTRVDRWRTILLTVLLVHVLGLAVYGTQDTGVMPLQHDVQSAEKYLYKVELAGHLGSESLHHDAVLVILGNLYWEKGDLLAAEAASTLHGLGLAEYQEGWIRRSTQHLCEAIDLLDEQRPRLGGPPESRALFEAATKKYYHACTEALLRLNLRHEAFHTLERGRARSFLNLLANRDLRFLEPAELSAKRQRLETRYDQLQADLAKQIPGQDDSEIDRLHWQLHELRTQQEAIREQIRGRFPELASLQAPAPLDLAQTGAALDPGTVLLSYSSGERKTLLFVVQSEEAAGPGFSVHTLPIGEKALRKEIGDFRNLLQSPRSEQRALHSQGLRLYNLLLRRAERQIASAERLLISPDGPLHTLPFAALRRREQYLVEWKPIHFTLSATVYGEGKKSRSAPYDPATDQLVAFGDPLYPAKAANPAPQRADPEVLDAACGYDFTPLPSTRKEVEEIAKLFPHSQAYLGAEATEERAKEVSPQARILHFACHGFLNDRLPLSSGLALTLPEQPAEGQDNGLLQAWEIFESVRLDADLVTLSACNTAMGQEMGGEGLVGLTRAFQYAGARSVVASIWGVADTSTSELMKPFYTHLRSGQTKDEALRAAQRELILSGDSLSHPYHWAAFQLFGDWR